MLPRVSVITVVKDAANTIVATIESVLSQDYPNLEYVVVDGQSNDGTTEIIKSYGTRIPVFVSEEDAGVYYGMQKGVERSTGSMILLLNADDTFTSPHALSSLVDARLACTARGPVVCYSDFIFHYPKLDRSFIMEATGDLERGMGLLHQAMLADRKAYDLVGGFDTSFRLAADFDWAVRAKRLDVHFLKFCGPPAAVFRHGGMSERQYRLSRAESERIIRREYGWRAYMRYAARQRIKFFLRSASASLERLFGAWATNPLELAYVRLFRSRRELR
jgi:glycosyltransferase involved in cell wall biosynthesis